MEPIYRVEGDTAETWADPVSIGIAAARLADRGGYFGRAVQSVLIEKR